MTAEHTCPPVDPVKSSAPFVRPAPLRRCRRRARGGDWQAPTDFGTSGPLGAGGRKRKPSGWLVVLLGAIACASPKPIELEAPRSPTPQAVLPTGSASRTWKEATRSPQPSTSASLPSLSHLCALRDGALDRAASRVARRLAAGNEPVDESELVFFLREEGCPYVWPKALAFDANDLDPAAIEERVRGWLRKQSVHRRLRCGLADETLEGRRVIGAVISDALGDLRPLPIRVRPETWLTLEADLASGIDAAKIVLLGPLGAPRAIPTSFDGRSARGSFSIDRAGAWTVQLVGSTAQGPRPVLEARVFAGVEPPERYELETAPGEREIDATGHDATALEDALARMVSDARRASGATKLARNATLDRVARRHAEAMRTAATTAHDVGDADPATRVEAAGLAAAVTGENVAHGRTLARAHRAIWASPSHRSNLLDGRFDTLGVGVAVDPDGSVWICELYAKLR